MYSPNQSIKPVTYRVNESGNVEIGGCDLVELANEYGTPLYVVDERTVREMCKAYKKAFSAYPKTKMMFASKALLTTAVCKILSSEGFGFDLVSSGEIFTAQQSGADMSLTMFNGNNKSVEEISLALDYGVGRFSVDNFLELSLLDSIARSKGKKVDILLRVTPGIECHTHEYIQTGHIDSKFGFDLSQVDEAVELIKEEYENLNLVGLHAHIGSQIFETKVYEDEVKILVQEFKRIKDKFGLELTELNLGGGVGIKYTEKDAPPSIDEVANVIITSLEKSCKEKGINAPTIIIEPGRSIVGTSGVTIYTLGSSKVTQTGKKYFAIDGGMADNARVSLYQAEYYSEIANKPNETDKEKVTISGRFCESGDILLKEVELSKIEEGDILCVFNTGAYGYSMSSNYNRVLKPAMVLTNQGQSDIIVKRETLDHLTKLDVIPKRLEN